MGAVSETVFESEMFGHTRGAFTDARADRMGRFELAHEGTLFMDEIGNVPHSQQQKLLRVLEDGEFERLGSSRTQRVDVRLISATNANLAEEVEQGRFRRDLLYRINTVEITVPSLRDRQQDIIPLASFALERLMRRYNRPQMGFARETQSALKSYFWPGNVRELHHVIERAVLLSPTDVITPDSLGLTAQATTRGVETMTLEDAEAYLVKSSVARHDGNLQQAADALGITRQSLYRRLEKYGAAGVLSGSENSN